MTKERDEEKEGEKERKLEDGKKGESYREDALKTYKEKSDKSSPKKEKEKEKRIANFEEEYLLGKLQGEKEEREIKKMELELRKSEHELQQKRAETDREQQMLFMKLLQGVIEKKL